MKPYEIFDILFKVAKSQAEAAGREYAKIDDFSRELIEYIDFDIQPSAIYQWRKARFPKGIAKKTEHMERFQRLLCFLFKNGANDWKRLNEFLTSLRFSKEENFSMLLELYGKGCVSEEFLDDGLRFFLKEWRRRLSKTVLTQISDLYFGSGEFDGWKDKGSVRPQKLIALLDRADFSSKDKECVINHFAALYSEWKGTRMIAQWIDAANLDVGAEQRILLKLIENHQINPIEAPDLGKLLRRNGSLEKEKIRSRIAYKLAKGEYDAPYVYEVFGGKKNIKVEQIWGFIKYCFKQPFMKKEMKRLGEFIASCSISNQDKATFFSGMAAYKDNEGNQISDPQKLAELVVYSNLQGEPLYLFYKDLVAQGFSRKWFLSFTEKIGLSSEVKGIVLQILIVDAQLPLFRLMDYVVQFDLPIEELRKGYTNFARLPINAERCGRFLNLLLNQPKCIVMESDFWEIVFEWFAVDGNANPERFGRFIKETRISGAQLLYLLENSILSHQATPQWVGGFLNALQLSSRRLLLLTHDLLRSEEIDAAWNGRFLPLAFVNIGIVQPEIVILEIADSWRHVRLPQRFGTIIQAAFPEDAEIRYQIVEQLALQLPHNQADYFIQVAQSADVDGKWLHTWYFRIAKLFVKINDFVFRFLGGVGGSLIVLGLWQFIEQAVGEQSELLGGKLFWGGLTGVGAVGGVVFGYLYTQISRKFIGQRNDEERLVRNVLHQYWPFLLLGFISGIGGAALWEVAYANFILSWTNIYGDLVEAVVWSLAFGVGLIIPYYVKAEYENNRYLFITVFSYFLIWMIGFSFLTVKLPLTNYPEVIIDAILSLSLRIGIVACLAMVIPKPWWEKNEIRK